MNATNYYLNAARSHLGLRSDYALAQALGLRKSTIGNYRSGRNNFNDAIAMRIASAAGVRPESVLLAMQVERASNDEARAVWISLWEKHSEGSLPLSLTSC